MKNLLLLVRYILLAAIRDKAVIAISLFLLCALALSIFLGSTAAIEQHSFSLVFAASSLRIAGGIGVILFVTSVMQRSFDAKDVEFILSKPISGLQFLSAYSLAFSIIAALTGIAVGLCVIALSWQAISLSCFLWAASLVVEYVMLSVIALFFVMVLQSAPSATMASLGVYIFGRVSGIMLGSISASAQLQGALSSIAQTISMVVPRFDLMAQSSWLIYGAENIQSTAVFIASSFVSFTALVLIASFSDLSKKEF